MDYNRGKCGVDKLDQLVRNYNCIRKCNRWPLTLFMNLLNIGAYNALVLFVSIHPEYEHKSGQMRKRFLIQLSKALIGCEEESLPNEVRMPARLVQQPSPRQKTVHLLSEGEGPKIKRCASCQKTVCAEHVVYKCLDC